MEWPNNIVEELAYRRCILFLGAGVSATSKNDRGESPETWKGFLNSVKTLIRNSVSEDERFIEDMLNQNNYLLALQAIADLCDPGEYSKFLKDRFLRGGYNPSEIHYIIKELDSKIVVTSNFDKLYESICKEPEYVTCDYTETRSIIASIKAPESIIIKAHGSIDDTEKIIFTAKQYYDAQQKYPEFYHLLSALFLTHTVLFIGYSLNDPDINLLLQYLHSTSNTNCPHYLIDTTGNESHLKKHWGNTYNVSVIEYGNTHDSLKDALEDLKDKVLQLRSERGMP